MIVGYTTLFFIFHLFSLTKNKSNLFSSNIEIFQKVLVININIVFSGSCLLKIIPLISMN